MVLDLILTERVQVYVTQVGVVVNAEGCDVVERFTFFLFSRVTCFVASPRVRVTDGPSFPTG